MSAVSNSHHRDLFKFLGLTVIFTLIFVILMEQKEGAQPDPTFFPHNLKRSADLGVEIQSVYSEQALDLEVNSPDWSDQQQTILESVAAIESRLGEFRSEEASLESESTEGGSVVSYFEGDQLQKTEKTYLGETGRREEITYFNEGKVIYIDSVRIDYSRPITMSDQDLQDFFYDVPEEEIPESMKTFTETLGTHDQYFFEAGELISWIQNGVEISMESEEFAKKRAALK